VIQKLKVYTKNYNLKSKRLEASAYGSDS